MAYFSGVRGRSSSAGGWLAGPVCGLALLVIAVALPARAQNFQSQAPFAFLLDSDSGAVLYEKAADELMVPASMAKIATALVAFQEIAAGRLSLDSEIGISENAWRRAGRRLAAPRCSRSYTAASGSPISCRG